jgi:hypothetical protein
MLPKQFDFAVCIGSSAVAIIIWGEAGNGKKPHTAALCYAHENKR